VEGGCVWSTIHERSINGPDGRFPKSKAEKLKKTSICEFGGWGKIKSGKNFYEELTVAMA
jgi:hypothetical protein